MTEPLSQLQEGDRVVHEVALVASPGEPPFQAGTNTPVPVEAARGD